MRFSSAISAWKSIAVAMLEDCSPACTVAAVSASASASAQTTCPFFPLPFATTLHLSTFPQAAATPSEHLTYIIFWRVFPKTGNVSSPQTLKGTFYGLSEREASDKVRAER